MQGGARANQGFTLIELVIVTVVLGILAAIAIPSYTAYIQRASRSEARGQLLMATQWMERYRTQTGSYTGAALPATLKKSPSVGTTKYTIDFDAVEVLTATTFKLTATPVGTMASDECGTLSIDHTGQLDQGLATANAKERCWDR
jgi:type IV pilus assembly protein PilE